MSTKTADSDHAAPVPTAPSTLQRWFPIAAWLGFGWTRLLHHAYSARVTGATQCTPNGGYQ